MRLTLINQFYRPDISPTAHLTASLAEHRAAAGDRVTVITTGGRYVSPTGGGTGRSTNGSRWRENPCVIRVWTPSLGKSTVFKRLLDYLAFYIGAIGHVLKLPPQDLIVSLTTPPYICWVAVLHKMIHRRTRVVLWNMDCYPDVVERAGIIRHRGILSRLLRAMNRVLFRQLDQVICLDTAMVELLCSQYADRHRPPPVAIIPNWEDRALFPAEARPPRWEGAASLGLNGNFVVLYLGNTGVGHAFETVLDAAERLRNEDVRFLCIGGGSRWESIRQSKEARRLDNVILHDYVAKEQTPSVMASADCALITLRDDALGVMSPSKLHSNLAMGLPVLYIGPRGSNVDDAVRNFDCGASIRHGDVEGVTSFIRRLAGDRAAREAMRQNARLAFDRAYCNERTLPSFDAIFQKLHRDPVRVHAAKPSAITGFMLESSLPRVTTAPGRPERALLIFSQVFVPDPASVGQHVTDVAVEMARRGHKVRVYASDRGYDDPCRKYRPAENHRGVDVRRLPLSSFGKYSLISRGAGTAAFMLQCLFIGLFTRDIGGILFSTSPPMIGVAATLIGLLRRVPVVYWAMDLNPDQLIALGKLRPQDIVARLLEAANRFILRHASLVVTLDRFMAERLRPRARLDGRMIITPPWPHEENVEPVRHSENPFRKQHGLDGKFVIMYSGNHSPSNPLNTMLEAILRLRDDPNLQFIFVGGGLGKKEVERFIHEHKISNALSLPYQPLSELRYSLSAADVHLVSLGDPMVGIVHPCKVYGAMAVGRPVLFLGPRPSHISDLLDRSPFGIQVAHGDVDAAVRAIASLRSKPRAELETMGQVALHVLASSLSMNILCNAFCDEVEQRIWLNARQNHHSQASTQMTRTVTAEAPPPARPATPAL